VQKARLHKQKMRETAAQQRKFRQDPWKFGTEIFKPRNCGKPTFTATERSILWTHTVTQLVALNTRPLRAVRDLDGPSSAFMWFPSRSDDPAVFVRIGVKDAASVLYKLERDVDDVGERSFTESDAKKRKIEAAPARVNKIGMNFFVDAIDRDLIEPTGAGCVMLCNFFNQAIAFCEKRDQIESLKQDQKEMLAQLHSDSLQNRFDTTLMDKIASSYTERAQ